LNELQVLKKLDHVNVVKFRGMGTIRSGVDEQKVVAASNNVSVDSADIFLALEYCAGGTLRSVVRAEEVTDESSTLYTNENGVRWLKDIASGLAYLHSANPTVIHRDLKLENVLLDDKNFTRARAKLVDFGLSTAYRQKDVRLNQRLQELHNADRDKNKDQVDTLINGSFRRMSSRTSRRSRQSTTQSAAASNGAPQPSEEGVADDGLGDDGLGDSHGNDSATPQRPRSASDPNRLGIRRADTVSRDVEYDRIKSHVSRNSTGPLDGRETPPPTTTTTTTTATATSHKARPNDAKVLPTASVATGSLEEYVPIQLTGLTGSLLYMAPEVFRREKYNEKADIFSFAVIAFELLSRNLLSSKVGGQPMIFLGFSLGGGGAWWWCLLLCFSPPPLSSAHHITTSISWFLTLQFRKADFFHCYLYAKQMAAGWRPNLPRKWPRALKDIVEDCWHADPAARPSADELVERLEAVLQSVQFKAFNEKESGAAVKSQASRTEVRTP